MKLLLNNAAPPEKRASLHADNCGHLKFAGFTGIPAGKPYWVQKHFVVTDVSGPNDAQVKDLEERDYPVRLAPCLKKGTMKETAFTKLVKEVLTEGYMWCPKCQHGLWTNQSTCDDCGTKLLPQGKVETEGKTLRTCPVCKGRGCEECEGTGKVTEARDPEEMPDAELGGKTPPKEVTLQAVRYKPEAEEMAKRAKQWSNVMGTKIKTLPNGQFQVVLLVKEAWGSDATCPQCGHKFPSSQPYFKTATDAIKACPKCKGVVKEAEDIKGPGGFSHTYPDRKKKVYAVYDWKDAHGKNLDKPHLLRFTAAVEDEAIAKKIGVRLVRGQLSLGQAELLANQLNAIHPVKEAGKLKVSSTDSVIQTGKTHKMLKSEAKDESDVQRAKGRTPKGYSPESWEWRIHSKGSYWQVTPQTWGARAVSGEVDHFRSREEAMKFAEYTHKPKDARDLYVRGQFKGENIVKEATYQVGERTGSSLNDLKSWVEAYIDLYLEQEDMQLVRDETGKAVYETSITVSFKKH